MCTGFYWVLLGFTGFYWILPSFTGTCLVLLGCSFSRFLAVLLGITRVVPDFTGFPTTDESLAGVATPDR